MRRAPWRWTTAGLMLAAATVVCPGAQPERSPSRDRDGADRQMREPDVAPTPEEARRRALAHLENRLNWTRRMKQRFVEGEANLLAAKERIEAGDDPEEVMRSVREHFAPDMRIRVQHGRSDGRPRGDDERPDRPPPGARPDDPAEFPPATPEQKYRVNQVLDVVIPNLSQRLTVICENQPERCEKEYARLAYRMQDLIQDGIADQALFELRVDDLRLSTEVVNAANRVVRLQGQEGRAEKLAEARRQVESLVSEQFDVRARIRVEEREKLKRELEKIQRQIEQLSLTIDEQQPERERIIEEQVAEALRQAGEGGRPIDPLRERRRIRDRPDN